MKIRFSILKILIILSGLLLVIELSRLFMGEKVIEHMDNNDKNCDGLDERTIQTIDDNTKEINTLRERINAINIKELNDKINSVDVLIKNNTDDLKDIIDQNRTSSNDDIGMDVKEDGSVYDENGKLIYQGT